MTIVAHLAGVPFEEWLILVLRQAPGPSSSACAPRCGGRVAT